jgi:hypothetical protein
MQKLRLTLNVSVLALIVAVTAVGCGKLNKYTPYKTALVALTKAYEKAGDQIQKVDTKEEAIGVFKTLAKVQEKSNPVIIKYHENFPELRDPKSEDYPESLKGEGEKFKKAMQGFFKKVMGATNLRPFQNDKKVAAALEEVTKSIKQLGKKLNQLKKKDA